MSDAVKILLAEDDKGYLREWIAGLQEDGFDPNGKKPDELIQEALTGIAKLTLGPHEMHITSSARVADGAVDQHQYSMCFMDGLLSAADPLPNKSCSTSRTIARLLHAPTGPWFS